MKNNSLLETSRLLYLAERKYGLDAALRIVGTGTAVRIPISEATAKASVGELRLDTRARNSLMRAKVTTVGEVIDLVNSGGTGLTGIRSLGNVTAARIRREALFYAYHCLSGEQRERFWQDVLVLNGFVRERDDP